MRSRTPHVCPMSCWTRSAAVEVPSSQRKEPADGLARWNLIRFMWTSPSAGGTPTPANRLAFPVQTRHSKLWARLGELKGFSRKRKRPSQMSEFERYDFKTWSKKG